MKTKKDLEETIKDKVVPLIEESMEKNWGLTIPKLEIDITDQLKEPQFKVYIPLHLPFQEAKKVFKAEFLKKELKMHLGNVSNLAKTLGIDRRSIHRAIKELDIDLDEVRTKESEEEQKRDLIDQTIRTTLDHYKEIIQPQKMEKMYKEIPNLSRNIAKFLPHQEMTWKEAEGEFEKQFLDHALKQNKWNISKTATKIEIRVETLHRKIRKLRLQKK